MHRLRLEVGATQQEQAVLDALSKFGRAMFGRCFRQRDCPIHVIKRCVDHHVANEVNGAGIDLSTLKFLVGRFLGVSSKSENRSVTLASIFSSTAYWIAGFLMVGSISFCMGFLVGRKHFPGAATVNTALRTVFTEMGMLY